MRTKWFAGIRWVALVSLALALVVGAAPTGAVQAIASATPLYAPMAATGAMVGTNAESFTGTGSWYSNQAGKNEWYIVPEAFGLVGKKIGDIQSVSYYTKNSVAVDFGLYIYTTGTAHGWYGERLTAEPMYSKNYSDPANSWNRWSTNGTGDLNDNQLTWYSGDHSVPMGWYTAPTLDQMQADGFKWSDYWAAADTAVVNYSNMPIKFFVFATGSAWSPSFQGYLDTIEINFKDGSRLAFDLENQPSTVYVDDSWTVYNATTNPTGLLPGQDPDGAGPAIAFGSDAFNTVAEGVSAVATGGQVNVAAGTYPIPTLITVNKDITITGAGIGVTTFEVNGTGHRLAFTAPGSTLEDVEIFKTDKTGVQNIIYLAASNITMQRISVHGMYKLGDPDVSRAIEPTGGLTGIVIQDSEFYDIRQPAYLNGSQYLIQNNFVDETRGWVLAGADVTFLGNTWGNNAVDIAIFAGTNPSLYTDLLKLSTDNGDAVIEDQRIGQMTHVWVDDTGAGNGYEGNPLSSIQAGIDKVVPGGQLFINNGTYPTASLTINKEIRITGETETGVVIESDGTAVNDFVYVNSEGVWLNKLTLQGNVPHYTAWPPAKPWYGLTVASVGGSVDNVTVDGFGKSGFNFHTVNELSVTNLTADNNGGAGIYLTNAKNLTLENLTTSNNQWGGVGINIIDKYGPAGTDGIVFQGTNSFAEGDGFQGGVYLEEEKYTADPGTISYSFDGSAANVKFPAGLFDASLTGKQNDDPTRRVRFYNSVNAGEAAALQADDPLGVVGPGHFLLGARRLTNLVTGEIHEIGVLSDNQQAVLNPDADGDNEIVATYDGNGIASINLWKYAEKPSGTPDLPAFAAPGVFYDVQVLNSTDPNATLTVVFEIPTGTILRYYDGSRWLPVRSNDGTLAKASGGYLTVVFGPNSTPKLSELTGTPVVSSAPEAVEIQIVPTDVQRNRSFDAVIVAKSTGSVGIEVHLSYDPAKLDLTGFVPAVTLPVGTQVVQIDETAGTIGFAHAVTGETSLLSGNNIVLGTASFTVLNDAALGSTSVGLAGAPESIFVGTNMFPQAIYPGTLDVLPDSVNITAETELHGQISLQGRPAGGSTFAGINVVATRGLLTFSDVTDTLGLFDILGLDWGDYTLQATFNGYLPAALPVNTFGPQSYTVPAVTLLGGNACYGDNVIDTCDLSYIGGQFLGSATDGSANKNADINGDGVVNILDLSMGGVNFTKVASPWVGAK